MKQIHISSAKEGMIIGRNIYDEDNRCLLHSGAKLTNNIINKLQSIGCNILCVDDGSDLNFSIEECLTFDERREIANNIKNLNIADYPHVNFQDITKSATNIVERVSKNKNIAFDLLDIRNDDYYDYNHALAVAELSVAIARNYRVDGDLVFNTNALDVLAESALLHNIGKSCKIKDIREKIGIFDEYKESDIPVYGYKLIHDAILPNASVISVGILFSKTYENKKNAPKDYAWALRNKGINYISKIINVANSYNNLIAQGKENNIPIGPAEAMEIIRDLSDDVFDKDIVNTFVRNVAIYPIGSEVTLSNGQRAIVVANNLGEEGFNYRPVVKTERGITYDLLNNRDITIVPDNAYDFIAKESNNDLVSQDNTEITR
jgi:HD-GYP domain-containing protein (c-di-GMP phosphodiesterase class II)